MKMATASRIFRGTVGYKQTDVTVGEFSSMLLPVMINVLSVRLIPVDSGTTKLFIMKICMQFVLRLNKVLRIF